MKERGISFSAPMVPVILAERKTVTRRVIKHDGPLVSGPDWSLWWSEKLQAQINDAGFTKLHSPYQSGDRLWVRETHLIIGGKDAHSPRVVYRATNEGPDAWVSPVWRPSIHMPKWAARIWLEVISVRPERLTEITAEDCRSEGIQIPRCGCEVCAHSSEICPADQSEYILRFIDLWQSLHGLGSWAKDPWVWRIEFRRLP